MNAFKMAVHTTKVQTCVSKCSWSRDNAHATSHRRDIATSHIYISFGFKVLEVQNSHHKIDCNLFKFFFLCGNVYARKHTHIHAE